MAVSSVANTNRIHTNYNPESGFDSAILIHNSSDEKIAFMSHEDRMIKVDTQSNVNEE